VTEVSENLTVRQMQLTDLDAVVAIERRAYEFPWTPGIFRDCLRAGYLCAVVETYDVIRGFGLMSFGAGECHILNLCTSPDARRDGLASKLLEFLLNEARRLRVTSAFLEMRESNEGARLLYEKFGFVQSGVRKNYYPHREGRENALVYTLRLY